MASKDKVLLLEDDPMVNLLMTEMLEEFGFTTIKSVRHCEDAVEALRTEDIGLAVLDLIVDETATLPIADLLRKRAIPFIFVTGFDVKGIKAKLKGAVVLKKPFGSAALDTAIKQVTNIGQS